MKTRKQKGLLWTLRYLPKRLSSKDNKTQSKMLLKSKRMYRKGKYYTRKPVKSFVSKTSSYILKARKMYGVEKIGATNELAKKTGCSKSSLAKIINKGAGAYFSSGSRPNQTAQSWGLARLASSITAGKAAAVDYDILDKGCDHNKKAFILANKSRKKYKYGHSKTKKINI